jgi:predicted nucleotidyltransferase
MSFFGKTHERILKKFLIHGVEFVLMGGHAAVFYGVRRTTSDIDILVKPTLANGERIVKAFKSLQLDISEISASDFTTQHVFTFGMEPEAVDILTYTVGVDVESVFKNARYHKIDDLKIKVIDLRDLLKNKENLNRKDEKGLVDQQDILALRRILKKK